MAAPGTLRHVDPTQRRGPVYRLWARIGGTRFMGWLSRLLAWRFDPMLHRLTKGRLRFTFLVPSAVLETTGARTGQARRHVVIYFHDGDTPVIMASHMGFDRHPGWYHNAVANPHVTLGGQSCTAEEVTDEAECARLWELADNVFPPFATYRQMAAQHGRTVPLLRLQPASPSNR